MKSKTPFLSYNTGMGSNGIIKEEKLLHKNCPFGGIDAQNLQIGSSLALLQTK